MWRHMHMCAIAHNGRIRVNIKGIILPTGRSLCRNFKTARNTKENFVTFSGYDWGKQRNKIKKKTIDKKKQKITYCHDMNLTYSPNCNGYPHASKV